MPQAVSKFRSGGLDSLGLAYEVVRQLRQAPDGSQSPHAGVHVLLGRIGRKERPNDRPPPGGTDLGQGG
jgi:hypothetical protein